MHHQQGCLWALWVLGTTLFMRTFQFKESYFIKKILSKRIQQISSEAPGKAPAQEVATPLSRTFHHMRFSAASSSDELFMPHPGNC